MHNQYTRADGVILHVLAAFTGSLVGLEKTIGGKQQFISAGFESWEQGVLPLAEASFRAEVTVAVRQSKEIIASAQSDLQLKRQQGEALSRLVPHEKARIDESMAMLQSQFELILVGHKDLMAFARTVGVEEVDQPAPNPEKSAVEELVSFLQNISLGLAGAVIDDDNNLCDNPQCPTHGEDVRRRMAEAAEVTKKQLH